MKRAVIMSDAQATSESSELSRIPFTVEAERQILTLSFWLTVIGWLSIAAAVIMVINLLLPARNLGLLADLILYIAVATWALQAARAFKSVATTDQADQAYLVQGFSKLRSIFLLQGVMILVGLAFVAAVLLFVVLHAFR
jgi:hypothetical protein